MKKYKKEDLKFMLSEYKTIVQAMDSLKLILITQGRRARANKHLIEAQRSLRKRRMFLLRCLAKPRRKHLAR